VAVKQFEELGAQSRAKRTQIVESARQLFLEHGFERTSMDAIRELAGVSKATLYNHYTNKEALFADVVSSIVASITSGWLPSVEERAVELRTREDLQRELTTLARRALATMTRPEYLALVRIVVADLTHFPQLSQIYRTAGPQSGLRLFASFLQQARARGLAEFDDPEVAARLFAGSMISYALIDGLLIAGAPHGVPVAPVDALVALFMRAIEPHSAG
jgi:TetR/AcrR family transcriptional repressor of mexJK operon